VIPIRRSLAALLEYPRFVASWRRYSRLPGAEHLDLADSHPCLGDRVPVTPYDPHYLHQAVWAFERILGRSPSEHVDIASDVIFVAMVSAVVPVSFVDIRALPLELPQLRPLEGDLLAGLPFEDRTVRSLSCLHVAEHVGLGRYGDDLAPDGTARACAELARVLASGGELYFSAPVGRPRVCFNAHRIHSPEQIIRHFDGLELVEFSLVTDQHRLEVNADLASARDLSYGCGLFRFVGL
jgi:SAM-dependent methyltransferase